MGKALIIRGADFSINGITPEHTRLNYICGSTDGNSHIDTNIKWGNNTCSLDDELEFSITLDSTGLGSVGLYTVGANVNINTRCCAWILTSGLVSVYFANATQQYSVNLYDGNPHTIIINKNGANIDGQSYVFSTPPTRYSGDSEVYTNIPIYIDSASKKTVQEKNTTLPIATAMKIHYVKYRRNGALMLDAVPVSRTVDNVVCYYDRVQGVYMTRNDGSTPVYG